MPPTSMNACARRWGIGCHTSESPTPQAQTQLSGPRSRSPMTKSTSRARRNASASTLSVPWRNRRNNSTVLIISVAPANPPPGRPSGASANVTSSPANIAPYVPSRGFAGTTRNATGERSTPAAPTSSDTTPPPVGCNTPARSSKTCSKRVPLSSGGIRWPKFFRTDQNP